ncbi:hypothetical protein LSM04_002585 [Trypanosoma melophagium]|uniref:uncharacterized protein n=1 Tax=Trypanosoma melophagium TaxID=715481 RepID=UPI00351A893A|nr:hypothetical protein LSM04_002585 [Trypanosoma melophagium]
MNIQQPRLSISNCVLPTAVDWVVLRKLREWHTTSKQTISSTVITPVHANPTPFWISAKVARHLANILTQENQTAVKTSCSSMNNKVFSSKYTPSSTAKRDGVYYSVNWDRAVNVFGLSYVNTADTSFASIVDSTTCVSYNIPIDETGDVLWSLLRRPSSSSHLIGNSYFHSNMQTNMRKQYTHNNTITNTMMMMESNFIKTRDNLLFTSPYWLNVSTLEKRWRGVRIASNRTTTPVYLKDGKMSFINAEQTTDASQFTSLSCIPQRRHQYLSCSGVQYFSWDFSEKLTSAFTDMKSPTQTINSSSSTINSTINSSSSMTLTNGKTDLSATYHTKEETMTETPSNLWLDVELIEMAGWSLQNTAVAIEVPQSEYIQLSSQQHNIHKNLNNKSFITKKEEKEERRIIVNAAYLVERDPLLDLIAYKPECLLINGIANVDAATILRLALFAIAMKYTNNTWLCASLVQQQQLRGINGNNITGVEAKLHYSWESKFTVTVLINVDELHITPEQLMQLRNRDGE